MTINEARQVAEDFCVNAGLSFTSFHSAKLFPMFSNKPNQWVVQFEAELPDEVVSGPEHILVIVDNETGQASTFDSL